MPGSKLRQAREARQLTLHEIEWATKIRAEFIQALEEDRYQALPSATHARGFLRSYAAYLGLDADALVEEFNHAAGSATEIVSTRPAVMPRRRDLAVTPGMIVGAALIVLIAIFGFYLKRQFDNYQASRAADAQPSPQLHLSALPTPSPTPTPSPVPSPSPSVGGPLTLVLRIDTRTWLQVDVDGKPSADTASAGKIFPAGTVLTFSGQQEVHVISGNPGNTFVTVNGKDLGRMTTSNKKYTRGQA